MKKTGSTVVDTSTDDTSRVPRAGPRSMQVADKLRASILSGEIAQGERVNEAQLSLRLGVSRTPTRAALHALAAEGLLDYENNRGFTVRTYSTRSVAEAYEVRAVLEGLACRLAAGRALDPEITRRFEAALRAGDAVVEAFYAGTGDVEAYRTANVAFHDTVIAAAGSQMVDDTLRAAFSRPAISLRNIVSFTPQALRRRHDDHHRIFEAISGGEGWRAELLMREHVTSVKRVMSHELGQRECDPREGSA